MRGASRQLKRSLASFFLSFAGLVALAKSLNPIPSRTRPLNSSAPMVLWLKPWESRSLPGLPRTRNPPLSMLEYEDAASLRGGGVFVCAFVFPMACASARFARPWPLASRVGIDHRHPDAFGRAQRYRGRIKTLETEYVDAEMIRRGALAVKRVDAAARAEKMLRPMRLPFVDRQQIFAAQHGECTLMHLRHQRVLLPAQRAIAGRDFN